MYQTENHDWRLRDRTLLPFSGAVDIEQIEIVHLPSVVVKTGKVVVCCSVVVSTTAFVEPERLVVVVCNVVVESSRVVDVSCNVVVERGVVVVVSYNVVVESCGVVVVSSSTNT